MEFNRPRTIAGDPDQCAAQIRELEEAYDVDEFVIVTICDTFEARLRSYELLAERFALAPARAA